jgi:hypothetical protein
MEDEYVDGQGEQEFPEMGEGGISPEISAEGTGEYIEDQPPEVGDYVDPEYEPLPEETGEWEQDPEGYSEPQEVQPQFMAPEYPPRGTAAPHFQEGGVLFTPDNDPLRVQPENHPLDERRVHQPWVSRRLRHLISEPPQPVYRDPSGCNRYGFLYGNFLL